ncbi:MarR family winged helix-turn-helix transcriptional regulator [Roseovarius indicus]|uniref:MarR family winged helix-turn-helix transcriptional regulator n=1 Tax=Roseovarius indicus TaxID=540747 RepID=UPI0009ECDB16|nr:MarR family winged helix-turn-helix transcriptional regulator [Roseovarius indicus]
MAATRKSTRQTGSKGKSGANGRPGGADGEDRFLELLVPLMSSPGVAKNAYRMSIFANFFNGPIYAVIQKRFRLLRDELNTLFCLAHFEELSPRDICLVMGRPKNSVSRAISRLQERDLIEVRDDPSDARVDLLKLKPAGHHLYEETRRMFVDREEQMLSSLTNREKDTLDRLLTKLMRSHETWSDLY